MLRILVEILLPLVLPTAVYLLWMWATWGARRGGEKLRWTALPWLWLAGAGALLLAAMLIVVTFGFGTVQQGVYVPPRWENGHIVPGHFEPRRRL